jgi:hypothetical protein
MFTLVIAAAESTPEAEDVVAGWLGFWVLMALIAATALICWSFTRQMKKVRKAHEAGVYGDDTDTTPDA